LANAATPHPVSSGRSYQLNSVFDNNDGEFDAALGTNPSIDNLIGEGWIAFPDYQQELRAAELQRAFDDSDAELLGTLLAQYELAQR
jgi:hypothetical protein